MGFQFAKAKIFPTPSSNTIIEFRYKIYQIELPPKTDPQVMLEYLIEGRQEDEQGVVQVGAENPPLEL